MGKQAPVQLITEWYKPACCFEGGKIVVVSVSFNGLQRIFTQTGEIQISLSNGTQVNHVMEAVQGRFPNLPLHGEDLLITVNDQISTVDHMLEERDKVSFLPHIGGG